MGLQSAGFRGSLQSRLASASLSKRLWEPIGYVPPLEQGQDGIRGVRLLFRSARGIVKLTEIRLADRQEVGVKRGSGCYILCRDSEIECQLDSASRASPRGSRAPFVSPDSDLVQCQSRRPRAGIHKKEDRRCADSP